MWQTIIAASLILSLMRVFPAIIGGLDRIKENRKLSRYFDYTICLITGEVVYAIAFNGIPKDSKYNMHYALVVVTLGLTSFLMWRTEKLSKSLVISLIFFMIGYYILGNVNNG